MLEPTLIRDKEGHGVLMRGGIRTLSGRIVETVSEFVEWLESTGRTLWDGDTVTKEEALELATKYPEQAELNQRILALTLEDESKQKEKRNETGEVRPRDLASGVS